MKKISSIQIAGIILLLTALVGTVSAYYGVSAEWVNNYQGTGLSDLSNNDENAQGFYYGLGGDASWTGNFIRGDDNSMEKHWKDPSYSGVDNSYMDNAYFGFFSGHGSTNGFYFRTNNDDTLLRYSDALWGNTNLDWVALDACEVLKQSGVSNWYSSFGGVHSIVGFDTTATDVTNRGSNFASRTDGTLTTQPVITAWFMAAADTESSSSYAAALAKDGTWSDYVYGHGSQGTPGASFLYQRYQC